MQVHKGFLLTSHVHDTSRGADFIFYGKAKGFPFKLIFPAQKIIFFIPHLSDFNPPGINFERKEGGLKDFSHRPVDTIYLNKISDRRKVKDYTEQKGLRTFELDIDPTERFLMERFINGHIDFTGEAQDINGIKQFTAPQIRPSNTMFKDLSILSLDIETGVKGEVYSIGLDFEDSNESTKIVLMLSDTNETNLDWLTYYSDEKSMLLAFIDMVRKLDPDIICGWHVIGFDLMFLEKKALAFGIELNLGRENKSMQLQQRKGAGFFANTYGRIVLDGPPVLRSAFYQFKNFKLETVASEVVGTGKDIASDANKVTEIERRFKEDKVALAKYNLLDCTLVLDIFKKLDIVNFLLTRVYISGLLIDRLAVSTAAFDHAYLPRLHRKGYVAPNRIDITRDEASLGGMVIEPTPGLHKDVAIFDFKSLYPSIIMTFKIDPLSNILEEGEQVKTPAGFSFNKEEHILPEIIQKLMKERETAKMNSDKSLSQSIKILMNSFYGVMGSSRCRFYHADLPQAITTSGHYILKTAMDFFENRGHKVLYGDTDSIFVEAKGLKAKEQFQEIAKDLDLFMLDILKDQFQITSRLECEFEKKYDQIFFAMTRSGEGAAKKKYAGVINGEIEFKGMESVRSDWTDLAKDFQHEIYQSFFLGHELETYIKDYIKQLKEGKFDDKLVYTKRLSKAPEEYVKNIPPHVQAALKINHTGPYRLKEVSYYITPSGPEPVSDEFLAFDYDHYIHKQIKPIADDVLKSINKSFDAIILGDQLSFL